MKTKVTMRTNTCEFPIVLEGTGLFYFERTQNGLMLDFNPEVINVFRKKEFQFSLVNIRVSTFCDRDIIVGYDENEKFDRIIPIKQIEMFYTDECSHFKRQNWDVHVKN
jgi:hypothetical protein